MTSTITSDESLFLRTLRGESLDQTPIWFMRQAGRYLPEYRELRAKAGSFLDLCYDPVLASEVTLQPVRRFDMDAAILFADILLIPHALGQKVWFVAGEGPRLEPALAGHKDGMAAIERLSEGYDPSILAPIYETVRLTRAALAADKALIGFAGAPWTVATYMLEGGPSKDPSALRAHYYGDPDFVLGLINLLEERTIDYLSEQIKAGVDAVQLFDSWAQGLPGPVMKKLCLEPARRITERIKQLHPGVPVIWFPKGAGTMMMDFAKDPLCDGIGIDTSIDAQWAREQLSPHATVQGNLDPLLVVAGGRALDDAVLHIVDSFRGVPHIFNLGHGFVPHTPIDHVARVISLIRERR